MEMAREMGMMGDIFGNMSFESSDEEVVVVVEAAKEEEVAGSEIGYQPEKGSAILVQQIRERGLSFQLWPAAAAMCGYLERSYGGEGLRGVRVLELGRDGRAARCAGDGDRPAARLAELAAERGAERGGG